MFTHGTLLQSTNSSGSIADAALCAQFTEAVVNLKFDEDPRYPQYAQLFEPLCGPAPQRPIILEAGSTKVGQKRGREEVEDAPDIVRPSCQLSSCYTLRTALECKCQPHSAHPGGQQH